MDVCWTAEVEAVLVAHRRIAHEMDVRIHCIRLIQNEDKGGGRSSSDMVPTDVIEFGG